MRYEKSNYKKERTCAKAFAAVSFLEILSHSSIPLRMLICFEFLGDSVDVRMNRFRDPVLILCPKKVLPSRT